MVEDVATAVAVKAVAVKPDYLERLVFFLVAVPLFLLAVPLFLADDDDPFVGIFRVFPAVRLSDVMPFAFFISATLTPYFFAMVDRFSPLRIV